MAGSVEFKLVAVADLIPYATNANTHTDEQVAEIAASIKEFGFVAPVITDGSNGIVAGHGRVLAARKLGLEEVPAVEASWLTPTQIKAYVLIDNKLAKNSEWDRDLLRLELSALKELDFDLSLSRGCSVEELRRGYEDELAKAEIEAVAKVAESLYKRALAGDNQAAMFILKARAGWKGK
jgi:ParB-like chromosome segregation protein Spo0J